MALVLCVAFVVIYFWDTHRLPRSPCSPLAFLAVSAALGVILRTMAKTRPKPFAITRGELAKDAAMLREPRA